MRNPILKAQQYVERLQAERWLDGVTEENINTFNDSDISTAFLKGVEGERSSMRKLVEKLQKKCRDVVDDPHRQTEWARASYYIDAYEELLDAMYDE